MLWGYLKSIVIIHNIIIVFAIDSGSERLIKHRRYLYIVIVGADFVLI